MKNILILLLLTLIVSCDKDTKKIEHNKIQKKELKKDSTKVEIADLPIRIDSTEYLIHPIGYVKEYGSRSSVYSSFSSESGYTSFSVSSFNNFKISGELTNLKFQNINSDKLIPLTDKIMRITSVTYLNRIAEQIDKDYLVYTVYDQDTNNDLKLDYTDVETLYLSNIDGSNFKKLTTNLHELVEWQLEPSLNRLYYKTIEDKNTNGDFDKTDKLHYFYINLENTTYIIEEYNPTN